MKPFRVLQFNMQFGQIWNGPDDWDAPIDLDRTIEAIAPHDADVIMLQEVEHAQAGGKQIEPPPNFSRLQEALPGYDAVFTYPKADPRELPFGIGLAIFSRTPLTDVMTKDLPSPAVEFDFFGETKTPTDRILLGARTEIDGRSVTLLNTHLLAFFMLKTSSEVHTGQRTAVGEVLRDSRGPTLLTGDFNVSRPDSLVDQYRKYGYETMQTEGVTWRRKPFVLDHIFFNRGLRNTGYEVVPTMASDHHQLVGDFVFAD